MRWHGQGIQYGVVPKPEEHLPTRECAETLRKLGRGITRAFFRGPNVRAVVMLLGASGLALALLYGEGNA